MKHKKYPKFEDYDFSDCREITGDELYRINGGGRIEPEQNENPPEDDSSNNSDSYTVQSGDTLSQIVYDYNQANGTHLTVDEVAALSGIENPDLILPGQSIVFSNPEQGGDSGQPVEPTAQGGQIPQTQGEYSTPNVDTTASTSSSVPAGQIPNSGVTGNVPLSNGETTASDFSVPIKLPVINNSTQKANEQSSKKAIYSNAFYTKQSSDKKRINTVEVQYIYDEQGKIHYPYEYNNLKLAEYNWNEVFLDGNNKYTEREGVDPKYVSFPEPGKPQGNFIKQLTTKESDEYCYELLMRKKNGFKVFTSSLGYGDGMGHFGTMTTYHLLLTDDKEDMFYYIDSDNNGVIDFVRQNIKNK